MFRSRLSRSKGGSWSANLRSSTFIRGSIVSVLQSCKTLFFVLGSDFERLQHLDARYVMVLFLFDELLVAAERSEAATCPR